MSSNAAYTHGHHESVLRSHQWRTAANSAGYLLEHLRPGMTVLDVGCGPGTITADLARRVAPGVVTGVENASGVLAEAARHAASVGVDNVEFCTGDIHALDYPDNTFDVVHAHQVLQHVHDPVQALREMRRVCKPGGIVAARDSDYAAFTWFPQLPALDEWLTLYQRVARSNQGEPDAGRRLLSWARAAGFAAAGITPTASVWCFADDPDREWWGGMWRDRVLKSAFAEQAVAGDFATEEDLRRMSDAWSEWSADPDGWMGILHGEILCRA